jgi:hypothetical protein
MTGMPSAATFGIAAAYGSSKKKTSLPALLQFIISEPLHFLIRRYMHHHSFHFPMPGDGDTADGADFAPQAGPLGLELRYAPTG